MAVTLRSSELLRFFDEVPPDSSKHANAIAALAGEDMAVGLLRHCLERAGHQVAILPGTPTQGTLSGVRLDRWVHVQEGEQHVLYQVEVKNWSAHSIGGRRVSSAASLSAHRRERWNHYWKALNNPKDRSLRKVLTPMRQPLGMSKEIPVRPLACVWDALHPSGNSEAFFSVTVDSDSFKQLWFFSLSNYLRVLEGEAITIDMPDAEARAAWVRQLFPGL